MLAIQVQEVVKQLGIKVMMEGQVEGLSVDIYLPEK